MEAKKIVVYLTSRIIVLCDVSDSEKKTTFQTGEGFSRRNLKTGSSQVHTHRHCISGNIGKE